MTLRAALVSLFAACLVFLPATASQPYGLAGKIITNAEVTPSPPFCTESIEWLEGFGSTVQLGPTETLTLEMAIIPFRSGVSAVGLDEGLNATTFVAVAFADGVVKGLPYNRYAWNDVTIQARPSTQDYVITVNGMQAGPFPYDSSCPGGCFSVQTFRFNASGNGGGAVAWIDSVSVSRQSAAGREFLAGVNFEPCMTQPYVTGGGLVFAQPPQRTRPRR